MQVIDGAGVGIIISRFSRVHIMQIFNISNLMKRFTQTKSATPMQAFKNTVGKKAIWMYSFGVQTVKLSAEGEEKKKYENCFAMAVFADFRSDFIFIHSNGILPIGPGGPGGPLSPGSP